MNSQNYNSSAALYASYEPQENGSGFDQDSFEESFHHQLNLQPDAYFPISELAADSRLKKKFLRGSDLAEVKKTTYPKITKKNFKPYFDQLSEELSTFKQNQAQKNHTKAKLRLKLKLEQNSKHDQLPNQSIQETHILDSPGSPPRSAALFHEDTRMLQKIPSCFFDKDFDLKNPSTFSDIVSLLTQSTSHNPFDTSEARIDSTQTQERLANYLDQVEIKLIKEISSRSSEFFVALSNLQNLHAETSTAISQISNLRQEMHETKNGLGQIEKSIISLDFKKSNLNTSLAASKVLADVTQTLPIILDLIESQDPTNALNLISDVEEMLLESQNSGVLKNCGFWKSDTFTRVSNQLTNALNSVSDFALTSINTIIRSKLLDFVYTNFQLWQFNSPLISESFFRNDSTTPLNSPKLSLGFHPKFLEDYNYNLKLGVKHLLNGMISSGKGHDLIKNIFRSSLTTLDEALDQDYPDAFQSRNQSLDFNDADVQALFAKTLRSMTFDDFLQLLCNHAGKMLLITQHSLFLAGLVSECLFQMAAPHDNNSQAENNSQVISTLLKSFLDNIIDTVNTRINKILIHRRDQTSKLSTPAFYSLFFIIRSFVYSFEKLTSNPCVSIRSCLSNLCKLYFDNLHNEKTRQLFLIIENEQWSQADVPVDFQELVDNLIASSLLNITSPSSKTTSSDPFQLVGTDLILKQIPISLSFKTQSHSSSPANKQKQRLSQEIKNQNNATGIGILKIGEENLPVVGSTLALLKTVYEYMQVAAHIPSLTTPALSNICLFLKSFNSRTCQVILGAGAVCSAGLKHISAKHIALVSRALDLVLLVITPIKKIFVSLLNDKQGRLVPSSFESVEKDYLAHKSELILKLIKIMNDRADIHVAKLASTNWETLVNLEPLENSESNSTSEVIISMESIFNNCKEAEGIKLILREIKKLHRILYKYLTLSDLSLVFDGIIEVYNQKIMSSMPHFLIKNAYGKLAVIYNIQYLSTNLSNIAGIRMLSNKLEIAANNINLVGEYISATSSSKEKLEVTLNGNRNFRSSSTLKFTPENKKSISISKTESELASEPKLGPESRSKSRSISLSMTRNTSDTVMKSKSEILAEPVTADFPMSTEKQGSVKSALDIIAGAIARDKPVNSKPKINPESIHLPFTPILHEGFIESPNSQCSVRSDDTPSPQDFSASEHFANF